MANTIRMSFLDKEITITQHRLGQTTNVPTPGSWEAGVLYNMMAEKQQLRIDLFGRAEKKTVVVDTMPQWLYYLFDRRIASRRLWDAKAHEWVDTINVPSIEHAEDIEIPALQWVFQQMNHVNNCVPTHDSIGQAVLLYRALKLLRLNEPASELRQQLLLEIKKEPLTAYDVQRIWWAFKGTKEWFEWVSELLANLFRNNVLDDPREGTDIHHFIEAEMQQLTGAKQRIVQRLFEQHRAQRPVPSSGPRDKARLAIGKGWGKFLCAPPQLVVRRERELVE
jgi:hypothetical protein